MAGIFVAVVLDAQVFNDFPTSYRWIGDNEVAFGFRNGGKGNFSVDVVTGERKDGVDLPADTRQSLPFSPDGAVNLTFSPDSTKMAFTRDNDLWVVDVATRKETRLTSDGSAVILNGYASWVYYEEIYGRASRYRAFWWSPDSRKIGFCRFDNTEVPVFPIYSPFPEDYDRSGMMLSYSQKAGSAVPMEGVSPTGGSVRMTRYPKCGDNNPKVRMGIADAETGKVVWADFNEEDDQYFGTPFWKPDGKVLFVQREPRTQNTLDLYAVSPEDGSKSLVYHESYVAAGILPLLRRKDFEETYFRGELEDGDPFGGRREALAEIRRLHIQGVLPCPEGFQGQGFRLFGFQGEGHDDHGSGLQRELSGAFSRQEAPGCDPEQLQDPAPDLDLRPREAWKVFHGRRPCREGVLGGCFVRAAWIPRNHHNDDP